MNLNAANAHSNTLAYAGAAAGATAVNSSWIDLKTLDAHGVAFLVALGAIVSTGTVTLKLQYSSDGSASAGDVAGSSFAIADTGGSLVYSIGIDRPTYRYVRVVMTRAVANSTILSVIAVTNLEGVRPQNVGTSLVLSSPAIGTA